MTTTTAASRTAPPALRTRTPGWRDPRIVIGVVIVAASVLLGARLMASADETTSVWSVRRDLPAGTQLGPAVLERRQIRFAESADADRYLSGTDDLAVGLTLARPVGAGELLPRSALASGDAKKLVEVPLSVAVDDVPTTVRQGSVVDVWVAPKTPGADVTGQRAVLVLDDVVVVSAPRAADSLAPESTRQIIVGVDPAASNTLGKALGSTAAGHVVITRQG
jgi:hypothetical protein